METKALTIFEPKNVGTIAQIAPQAYNENRLSHDRCIEVGNHLFTRAAAEGMSDSLDQEIALYIERAKKTLKKMNAKRSAVTQMFDMIRSAYTTLENEIDVTKKGTVVCNLQSARNAYAAEKQAQLEAARREQMLRQRAEAARAKYAEDVVNLDNDTYDQLWQDAASYNQSLLTRSNPYLLSDEQKAEYDRLLDVSGLGVMGYIEIPSIDCSLPIYHGTEESVLQIAVGHLKWSSLPVGGESTHCVLSGHRGLPSAKLFTNLDKLQAGDIFLLRVLDEVLTYEVDQILIVEPQETGALRIEKGKDYCTLVTCTPYGINTHRLLVRGHRIDNIEEAKTVRVTADAIQIEPLLVAPVVAIPILLLLLILLLLPKQPRKKHGGDADEED